MHSPSSSLPLSDTHYMSAHTYNKVKGMQARTYEMVETEPDRERRLAHAAVAQDDNLDRVHGGCSLSRVRALVRGLTRSLAVLCQAALRQAEPSRLIACGVRDCRCVLVVRAQVRALSHLIRVSHSPLRRL